MAGEIHITNRESLTMSEVSEVLSFEEDLLSVMTPLGKVEIEGSEMRILSMSQESGVMEIRGRIDGVYYSAKPSAKKGLFKRGN